MERNLSPAFVASAKCEEAKERSIFWDKDLPGFGLQVTSAGHKSFVCQYRVGKRSRRMRVKALKLGEARKEAKAIMGQVAKNHDPLAERRQKERAAENTLQSVCESYFTREGRKLRTVAERERTLRALVYPVLGAKQIDEVRRSDVVRLLDKIEDASGKHQADHALAYLRRVFTWYTTRSDDFKSPITKGMARTSAEERKRDRTLTDDEIRAIWRAADSVPYGSLVRFLLLTATRRDDAAGMLRSELNGDKWTIPASRYKNKRDHVVPLSAAAKAIIDALPPINGGDIVFTFDGKHYMGAFSKFKRRLDAASGVTDWRLHDLRRTARTLLSRAKVDADIGERCLGHVIGGVRGVYDKHAYIEEKRQAFQALAALVVRVLEGQDNVTELRQAS